jgi:hypothetical protein
VRGGPGEERERALGKQHNIGNSVYVLCYIACRGVIENINVNVNVTPSFD